MYAKRGGGSFEKRDDTHPPGWLVGLEVQQKRYQKAVPSRIFFVAI